MKRLLLICCTASVAAALAACGEREQTASGRKSDKVAWQGAQNPYVAPGWTAGDRASWEEQLRNRAQAQNEYTKVP